MFEAICRSGNPDEKRKSCFDCYHNQAAYSWWCVNKDAVKWRGSSIPGGIGCPFWRSVRILKDLGIFDRVFSCFLYIYIDCENTIDETFDNMVEDINAKN